MINGEYLVIRYTFGNPSADELSQKYVEGWEVFQIIPEIIQLRGYAGAHFSNTSIANPKYEYLVYYKRIHNNELKTH